MGFSSSSDSIFGVETTRVNVGVGATIATLVDIVSGQNTTYFKFLSGGSCEIIGVSAGVTLTAAQLATASGTCYPMTVVNEVISFDGPLRCYLSGYGATSVVAVIKGKSSLG